jgi:flavin-dependent thymidylate synthase
MSQIKVELQEFMGSDRSIATAAWTSSYSGSLYLANSSGSVVDKHHIHAPRTDADVERVVNMLADSGHASPFESVVCRFWIKMPVATDRQHMTHRIASHNGMSGRYRTLLDEFLEMPEDVKAVARKLPRGYELIEDYDMLCTAASSWYQETINGLKALKVDETLSNVDYKRLREFIRGVLPQHQLTERTSIFNLRSLANYFRLRLDPAAQPEIREVARQMLDQLNAANVCPVALRALARNNWVI